MSIARERAAVLLTALLMTAGAGISASASFHDLVLATADQGRGNLAEIFSSSFEPYTPGPSVCGEAGTPLDRDGDGLLDRSCITAVSSPDPVVVAPPMDPTVPSEFGAAVEFLIEAIPRVQHGTDSDVFEPHRISVLRGVVRSEDAPLEGVLVRVLDHPEYGYTFTRSDGVFDIVVNGGGQVVLDYAKDGFLRVQRSAVAPWKDWEWVPDATLTPLSATSTTIPLGPQAPPRVIRGDIVSDDAGEREPVLLVPSALNAMLEMHDGSHIPLGEITLRTTEYTVGSDGPSRMPAPLPASSSYTYAVEFTADEAQAQNARTVLFDKPLGFYLDNFLNFPVGTVIPAGHYDFQRASWLPSDDGRVVKILSIGSGTAELDVDGSGSPADIATLAGLGIGTLERQQLAGLYPPGKVLWRTPVNHFTPWDCNFPYTPDPDDEPPPEKPEDDDDDDDPEDDPEPDPENPCASGETCPGDDDPNEPDDDDRIDEEPEEECGSLIRCAEGTLLESIPIAGSKLSLVYSSKRLPSTLDQSELKVRVSSAIVPPRLIKASLEMTSLGKRIQQDYNTLAPNTIFRQPLDRVDAYGRVWTSGRPWRTTVSYHYPLVYSAPRSVESARAWARFAASENLALVARQGMNYTLTRTWEARAQRIAGRVVPADWDARGLGNGGWSLSSHHVLDQDRHVIYLGHGSEQRLGLPGRANMAVAETLVKSLQADDLRRASRFDSAPDGSLYVLAKGSSSTVPGSSALWRYDYSGQRTQLADLCATQALNCIDAVYGYVGPDVPRDVAVDDRRMAYVVAGRYVFTVSPSGSVTRAFDGALQTPMCEPRRIDAEGDRVYFTCGTKVFSLWRDGQLTHLAGGGSQRGVDVVPEDYGFGTLTEIAVDREGQIYVFEADTAMLYRIGGNGVVEHVAGNSTSGFMDDGTVAINGALGGVVGLSILPNGNPVFGVDWPAYRIRELRKNGRVFTLAGGGPASITGISGGDQLARSISMEASDVEVLPDGSLSYMSRHQGGITRKGVEADQAVIGVIANSFAVSFDGYGAIDTQDYRLVSRDGTEEFRFDDEGRHLATYDTTTGALRQEFGYDSDGYLTSVGDVHGNVTTLERDPQTHRASSIVAEDGQRTELTYTSEGLLHKALDPMHRSWELDYLASTGLLRRFERPRGFASTFTWLNGKLSSDTNAEGGGWSIDHINWASTGETQTSLISAMGRENTYSSNNSPWNTNKRTVNRATGAGEASADGNEGRYVVKRRDGVEIREALSPDPRFAWNAPFVGETIATVPGASSTNSALTSNVLQERFATANGEPGAGLFDLLFRTTVNGDVYEELYDSELRKWLFRSPEGREQTVELNAKGQPSAVTSSGLAPTRYIYDSRGRIQIVERGSGPAVRQTSFTYNSDGWLETVTDAENRSVTIDTDVIGRPTRHILAGAREVVFGRDPNGNIESVTPPGRPAHTFTFDRADQMETYTAPVVDVGEPSTTTYDRNLDGQLTGATRPGGGAVELTYHPTRGLLTRLESSERSAMYVTTDGYGRTTSAEDYRATWTGPLLRSQTSTLRYGAGSSTERHVRYDYDDHFRVKSVDLRSNVSTVGQVSAYTYDRDGLIKKVDFGGQSLTIGRDPLNGLETSNAIGSSSESWTFNEFAEPTSHTSMWAGSPRLEFAYTRDKLGRIIAASETRGGSSTQQTYEYDAASRLTHVRQGGALIAEYGYDANSNRTSAIYGGAWTGATPGCAPATGTFVGIYDLQDRMTQYGSCSYTYRPNGELESRSNPLTGEESQFAYDEFGNLLRVDLADGTEIEYFVDGLNRRLGKRVDGQVVRSWMYKDQLEPVAELDGSGAVISVFSYGARRHTPVMMRKGGVNYRIVSDHLGSVRQVVRLDSGAIAQELRYDVWGNVLEDTNPGFQPFGYAGGMQDEHTGFIRFGYRDYDPITGRWTSKDPVRFASAQTNLYAYVRSNPIDAIDPTGLLEIHGYQNRGRGYGWETEYQFRFNALSPKPATGLMKVGKVINRVGAVVDFLDTEPAGPNHPWKDYWECGILDAKLQKRFEGAGYEEGDRLTRKQAEDFLNDVYNDFRNMDDLYPPPSQMLDTAEENSKDHWMYSLNPGG